METTSMIGTAQFWIVIAAIALITELFSVSFFFFFLAIGAAITALLTWLGVLPNITTQMVSFAGISLITLALFRSYAIKAFGKNEKGGSYSEFVGDSATISVAIPAHGEGKAHYRGTEWIARSSNGQAIEEGASVTIKKMDGIKVVVE
jgi:membrane protein implicated in regulation of membrane protease activity